MLKKMGMDVVYFIMYVFKTIKCEPTDDIDIYDVRVGAFLFAVLYIVIMYILLHPELTLK